MSGGVLLVDDQADVRTYLAGILRQGGYQVHEAAYAEEAIEFIQAAEHEILCVVMDVDFGSGRLRGSEAVTEIRKSSPHLPVILLSASGTTEEIVQSLRRGGATAFLDKGLYVGEVLPVAVGQVDYVAGLRADLEHLRGEQRLDSVRIHLGDQRIDSAQFVGSSEAVTTLNTTIAELAPGEENVLILGEPGSGRKLAATNLALADPQRGRLDRVFCSLFSGDRLGSSKGFSRFGEVDEVDGSDNHARPILVLCDIGALSIPIQDELVVEFDRMSASARIVATAGLDLPEKVKQGLFKPELEKKFGVSFTVPSLAARAEDIPSLIGLFSRTAAAETGRSNAVSFTPEALSSLCDYRWPGNVRELRQYIEQVTASHQEETVGILGLPPHLIGTDGAPDVVPLAERIRRRLVGEALRMAGGDEHAAAEALGLRTEELKEQLSPERKNSAENLTPVDP